MQLGDNIKKWRRERGFSQQGMAKKLNLSQAAYSYYENNKRIPKIDTLKKIADILEISLNLLLDFDDESTLNEYLEKAKELEIPLPYITGPRGQNISITAYNEMLKTIDPDKLNNNALDLYLKEMPFRLNRLGKEVLFNIERGLLSIGLFQYDEIKNELFSKAEEYKEIREAYEEYLKSINSDEEE